MNKLEVDENSKVLLSEYVECFDGSKQKEIRLVKNIKTGIIDAIDFEAYHQGLREGLIGEDDVVFVHQ